MFGKCEGKARWLDLDDDGGAGDGGDGDVGGGVGDDVPDEFLKEGWLKGKGNGGGKSGSSLVLACVRSLERDWEAFAVCSTFTTIPLDHRRDPAPAFLLGFGRAIDAQDGLRRGDSISRTDFCGT